MPAIFNHMMQRQVHQPHIKRPIALHQIATQMINRRVFFMIGFVIKIRIIEKTIRLRNGFIFFIQPTLFQPHEKSGIDFINFLREKFLEQGNPSLPSFDPAPRNPKHTPTFRRLRLIKKPNPPECLPISFNDFILLIRHGPADGARPHIQPDVVIFRQFFLRHD